ncbi:hypothetical protein [Streptomyces sp. NPDC059009]|uniref:hypothetical protein n=1 Tax=Streptomyces sp. NPDC059009 TaxID=3346694 RepID=UPI0036AAFF8C
MCACDPPCTPLEGDWPEERCPNPECAETATVKPVAALEPTPGAVGLTFHCRTCPCRWYSVYDYATEGES